MLQIPHPRDTSFPQILPRITIDPNLVLTQGLGTLILPGCGNSNGYFKPLHPVFVALGGPDPELTVPQVTAL